MKKSNFIFYWIELAVRRGRRRELGGGGVLHASRIERENFKSQLASSFCKISASRTDLIMRFVKNPLPQVT